MVDFKFLKNPREKSPSENEIWPYTKFDVNLIQKVSVKYVIDPYGICVYVVYPYMLLIQFYTFECVVYPYLYILVCYWSIVDLVFMYIFIDIFDPQARWVNDKFDPQAPRGWWKICW
jgi:hypothetical protein